MASKKNANINANINTDVKQDVKFDKSQILASKKYASRRDILGAILEDQGSYTLCEVDSLLEKFMKRKVD